ncbi:MAG: alpha/beta hydrolase, partial [Spirochaetia bacterium]|nr:alpha/beta hydrolase [Spirochaetia bacterium]
MKTLLTLIVGWLAILHAEGMSTNLIWENPAPKDILKPFSRSSIIPESFCYMEPGGRIRLVKTGKSRTTSIVFVHGSPGDWKAWSSYLTNQNLLSRATLISLDRPGFGGSDPGIPERSVKIQSDRIYRAFRELSLRDSRPASAVWIGHSYGGPVIARLAMDHPEAVQGLLFIGAPFDPELETIEWYQKVGAKPCVSRILPKIIYVVNEELFPLKGELQ